MDPLSAPPAVQIAVDCEAPHPLARFWASALGYEVEVDEEFVRAMLEAGHAGPDDVTEYAGVLTWRTAAAISDPEGARPRIIFQQVPEPKTVKDRIHLDIQVGADRRDAEVSRLLSLGASRLWEGRQGPNSWITLADPEGNEFCVS